MRIFASVNIAKAKVNGKNTLTNSKNTAFLRKMKEYEQI